MKYKSLLSTEKESWNAAIERYMFFLRANMADYFPQKDFPYYFSENRAYRFHKTSRIDSSYISEFTDCTQIKVPVGLRSLLSEYGTFYIGDGIFKIFDTPDNLFFNVTQILEKYGYTEILNGLGQGMIKSLNSFYFFFGISFPQTDETSFLFFNKTGNFGKIRLLLNNKEKALRKTFPSMFNGSIEKFTLDSLISDQIDRIIITALMVRGYI